MGLVLRTKSGFACQVISYRFKREGSAEGISGAMTACVPLRAQGSEDSIWPLKTDRISGQWEMLERGQWRTFPGDSEVRPGQAPWAVEGGPMAGGREQAVGDHAGATELDVSPWLF